MSRIFAKPVVLLASALLLFGTACQGTSDAARVLEADNSSLRATIAFYQSIDPTLTIQSADALNRVATMQSDLERSRQEVRSLTIRLNNAGLNTTPGAVAANPTAVTNPGVGVVATTPAQGNSGGFASYPTLTPLPSLAPVAQTTPVAGANVSAPSGLALENVTTARDMDGDGCPVDITNVFGTSESRIYIFAVARSYAAGTVFSATWKDTRGFEHTNDWTVEERGDNLCIHFYVEPRTLQMAAGSYTVVFAASHSSGSVESPPIAFSIQAR